MFFGGGKSFTPEEDIPDLSGKVILVTGGNAGLGLETIIQFSKHNPSCIYLAARDTSKASQAVAEVLKATPNANIKPIPLDLTSFASIKSAAEVFKGESTRLDILINNAGIMATPYSKTADGYEIQFGTNHVGHALLTKLLLPTLLQTASLPGADVRIVSVSSEGHKRAPAGGIQFDQDALETESAFKRYAQSKLANILYAKQLAARYPGITAVSVHPGVIITNLYSPLGQQSVFMKPFVGMLGLISPILFSDLQTGAKNQLWASTAKKEELANGAYYLPIGKPSGGTAYARDEKLGERLWTWTESELSKHGF